MRRTKNESSRHPARCIELDEVAALAASWSVCVCGWVEGVCVCVCVCLLKEVSK